MVAERSALGEHEGTSWLRRAHPDELGGQPNRSNARLATNESIAVQVGDEVLAALPAGVIKLVKVDAQGYDHFVVNGLHDSLLRNPDAVLVVEVAPEQLHEAGTSACAFVADLVEQGFRGWELHPHRAFRVLAPETTKSSTAARQRTRCLSRRPDALARAIGKLFPGASRPSGSAERALAPPAGVRRSAQLARRRIRVRRRFAEIIPDYLPNSAHEVLRPEQVAARCDMIAQARLIVRFAKRPQNLVHRVLARGVNQTLVVADDLDLPAAVRGQT